jgi:hypothetical protein
VEDVAVGSRRQLELQLRVMQLSNCRKNARPNGATMPLIFRRHNADADDFASGRLGGRSQPPRRNQQRQSGDSGQPSSASGTGARWLGIEIGLHDSILDRLGARSSW